jgi:hypothetical protein
VKRGLLTGNKNWSLLLSSLFFPEVYNHFLFAGQ